MKILKKFGRTSRLSMNWFIVFVLVTFLPLSITNSSLQAQEPAKQEPSSESTNNTGPTEPTGPENSSYTYNEETGLWENDYYTWNPNTKLTAPKTEKDYSYNPETEMWDTTEWIYTPEVGGYEEQAISAPTNTSQPDPVPEKANQEIEPTKTSSRTKPNTSSKEPTESTNRAEPKNTTSSLLNSDSPESGNNKKPLSVSNSSNNLGYFDNFFNADISVSVTSNAKTGDASVLQNTKAGNALTGDASAIASIMNLVQSTWGFGGIMPEMYTENIQGDYFGDILLEPSKLVVDNSPSSNELVVNNTKDVAIENNIDLMAESGNALVESNTEAGNATSGDATAILNLMNIINSSISTGQSFIGMLNVYGDLEGDVLLPENLLDSLIASNAPKTSINLSNISDNTLDIDNNVNQTISNDINAIASSGNAEVAYNTEAGDAISGDATTDITVFNLLGSRLIAEQALLVFVQVQGEWIGFITNAPENSNAALLGGGVVVNDSGFDAEFNNEDSSLIQNNVNLSASSGEASVLNNTKAGNATSGDANVVGNITNITNSSFSLSNWFGLLFINVFGDWSGSFGTNTPFGSLLAATTNNGSSPINIPAVKSVENVVDTGAEPVVENVKIFAVSLDGNSSGGTSVTSATPIMEEDVPPQAVLASSSDENSIVGTSSNSSSSGSNGSVLNTLSDFFSNTILVAIIISSLLAVLFLRRRYTA
jgi:hypothetical protein